MIVIGLTGLAFSGKSTAAKVISKMYLEKTPPVFPSRTVMIQPIAAGVKKVATEGFGWDGKKDERGRRLLQLIGTEVGRAYDPDLWIKKWKEKVALSQPVLVIADDLRFENEANVLHAMEGKIIQVEAPDEVRKMRALYLGAAFVEAGSHVSEVALPDHCIDFHLCNYDNQGKLEESVTRMIEHLNLF